MHEFLGHHVAIDGPLWRTLTALLVTPGRLTTDYFAGRRAHYIAPLRLYLTFSLVLFLVSGFSGGTLRIGNEELEFRLPNEVSQQDRESKLVLAPPATIVTRTGIALIDERIAHIESMTMTQRGDRLRAGMRAYLPYVLIVLVPGLALLLKIAYWNRGRLYGEHLVVAFHAQTVGFIFALVSAIPFGDWFGSLIWIALFAQGFVALRRVYGGRRSFTLVRESLLFGCYGLAIVLALALTATLSLAL